MKSQRCKSRAAEFVSRTLLYLIVVFLLGCSTSAHMTKEEVSDLKPTEGLLVGTIKVDSYPWETGVFPLVKMWAKGFGYRFYFRSVDENRSHYLDFDYAEEKDFVVKLKAGEYKFTRMMPTHPLGTGMHVDMAGSFTVYPATITYIGKLTVTVPDPLNNFVDPVKMLVQDREASTLPSVRKDYGIPNTRLSKQLLPIGVLQINPQK